LGLKGSDSRIAWRDAHDKARQSATVLDAETSQEAARFRVIHLAALNRIDEAISVIRETKLRWPEAQLQGLLATAHLYRLEFSTSEELAAGGKDMDSKIALALAPAHQLTPDSIRAACHLYTSSEDLQAQSIGAELAGQLSFMRGDVTEANRWAERAIDAGTEMVDGWRHGERHVLEAASLLARGSLNSFLETSEDSLQRCRHVGNWYSEYRLLHLQLHLATLQDDRKRCAELRKSMELLEPTIPPLFLDGPLYGLGKFLAQSEEDIADYKASTARSIVDHLGPIMKTGFVTAVDRPIMLNRIYALASLRLKRRVGIKRRFDQAIAFADERGWIIEAAIARVQLGEVAPSIKMPRPDTSEPEELLERLGIKVAPLQRTASRAIVLSLRTTALTTREQEVMNLVADGLNLHQIAERLKIGLETVQTHAKNAKAKQGMDKITAAKTAAMITTARSKETSTIQD
jgi:DNA-binding CsgD family transcriptional regulator